MSVEVTYAILPASWAPYLINSDATPYDDSEYDAMKSYEEYLSDNGWYIVGIEEDMGFVHYHDAYRFFPYAANCEEFVLHRQAL